MKNFTFTRFMFAGFLSLAVGFGMVKAQGCDAYYPMKKGAAFELSHFNAKDKLESTTSTTILEESNAGDVFSVTAESVSKDAKGKESSTVKYDVTCQGGEFHMDMRSTSFGQSQQMEGMENVEMKIESEDMVFPKGLTVGTVLPDAGMTMTASMNGMTIMNTTIRVFNRKVTAKEELTTTAGKFSCVVIEEDIESKMMGMNVQSHTKSWYALGVGMVRSENSSNGKPQGYTLLTKISGN
ncbi:MAG: hypothetical protein IPP17_06035 [Bacteroidetes bacterium]|nr:hypothetical protein [Bacteroidota bacterium]